jgi:hypothetical protein
MKTQTIKMGQGAPDFFLETTVDIMRGKRGIELREDTAYHDGNFLRPREAERLAKALLRMAAHVRKLEAKDEKRRLKAKAERGSFPQRERVVK